MEPRIQYAKTMDGVSIAFWTLGEGTPLVHMPLAFSHIEMEWHLPEFRNWYEALAEKRKLVRYDPRGFGLSVRNVTAMSLDTFILDLEAVVDSLGLESFALFGGLPSGGGAIAYAARHPERVSHLLLWCTWALASDYHRSSQIQALVALRNRDWETFTEMAAHIIYGWT